PEDVYALREIRKEQRHGELIIDEEFIQKLIDEKLNIDFFAKKILCIACESYLFDCFQIASDSITVGAKELKEAEQQVKNLWKPKTTIQIIDSELLNDLDKLNTKFSLQQIEKMKLLVNRDGEKSTIYAAWSVYKTTNDLDDFIETLELINQ